MQVIAIHCAKGFVDSNMNEQLSTKHHLFMKLPEISHTHKNLVTSVIGTFRPTASILIYFMIVHVKYTFFFQFCQL